MLRPLPLFLLLALLLGPTDAGGASKAEKLFRAGERAEKQGDFDTAFERFAGAVSLKPERADWLLRREAARQKAVANHLHRGDSLQSNGDHVGAFEAYRKAVELDPGRESAQQRLDSLRARHAGPAAETLIREVPTPDSARRELAESVPPFQIAASREKKSLALKGGATEVIEQAAAAFGVRAVFEENFPTAAIRLRAPDLDFETAMLIASRLTKSFWRSLDAHTILFLQDSPDRRKQYDPQELKSFLLPDSLTPEQMNEMVRTIREMAGIQRTVLDTRSRTLTLRDVPARVRIAEEVIQSLEGAPAEVILEVVMLEVDRQKATELGVIPPEQARILSLGQIAPGQNLAALLQKLFATGIDISGLTPEQLAALLASGAVPGFNIPPLIAFGGGRTIFFTTLPGATASLRDLVSVTRDARRAILRARDGQLAKLHVGDRFPIILASFSSIFFTPAMIKAVLGGTFVPPIPAVQYEDLGLKIEATPYVHAGGEVTLHLKYDLRSLTGVSLNGVPILSNRSVEQQIRLRDGETTVMAGIVSQQAIHAREGTPGASQVLGQRTATHVETELILSVTTHIVRHPFRLLGASRGIYAGTEAYPKPRP